MSATYDAALYATERRTIVFVDAGFLLAVMQEYHQARSRAELSIDHPTLVDQLRRRAEQTLGCPVLRIYWYDAVDPIRKVPNLVAAAIGRVDGVRVRLGTLLLRPDGRFEQKAVDTLLVRDMIAHAYKRSAGEMVLVSGDNDLVPGVEEAQEQGVRVHLWSIRGEDLSPSVGRNLADIADSQLEVDAAELAESIRKAQVDSPPAPPIAVTPGTPQVHPAPSGQPAESRPVAWPTPHPPPRPPVPPPAVPPTVEPQPAVLSASVVAQTARVHTTDDDASFPTLYDLDREAYNAPTDGSGPSLTGFAYAGRWSQRARPDELLRMQERRDPTWSGNIPKPVDSDLLFFGLDHGVDTYANHLKLALRKGFWDGIAAAGQG